MFATGTLSIQLCPNPKRFSGRVDGGLRSSAIKYQVTQFPKTGIFELSPEIVKLLFPILQHSVNYFEISNATDPENGRQK